MKNKLAIGFIVLLILYLIGCSNGTNDSVGGGESIYAGRDGLSPRSIISRVISDAELDKFSIQVEYMVGKSTNGFDGWGILEAENSANQIIPITSQLNIGDLSDVKVKGSNNFCDFVIFDLKLLYEGEEIANFPETMFIKGEERAFYQHNHNNDNPIRTGWTNCKDIIDKGYLVKELGYNETNKEISDDFAVIPFDGIDLTRRFDLKLEWNIALLISALENAKGDEVHGDYGNVQNDNKPYLREFINSFSLKVFYLN